MTIRMVAEPSVTNTNVLTVVLRPLAGVLAGMFLFLSTPLFFPLLFRLLVLGIAT
jgi:hypothetical protein